MPDELQDVITCEFCQTHIDLSKKIYIRPDNLGLYRCPKCNLIYVNPRPKMQTLLNKIYNNYYFKGARDFHRGANYLEIADQGLKNGLVGGLVQLKKIIYNWSGIQHLDIGCGGGALLVATRKLGAVVKGTEIIKEGVDYARRKYQLDVFYGTLEQAQFPNHSFDLVTAFNLLEHVEHPKNLLIEIHRILSNKGIVALIIPNARCLDRRGSNWEGLQFNMEHLTYFYPEVLLAILKRLGFKPTYMETFGYAKMVKSLLHCQDKLEPMIISMRRIIKRLYPLSFILRSMRDYYQKKLEKKGFGHDMFIMATKID